MQPEHAELEVVPTSALAEQERASIDIQIATAKKWPRSIDKFKANTLTLCTEDVETAESCIYARPVGGGKTAEGPSVRMAEIVAANYGNIRVAVRVVEQTPRYVKCQGFAHDLESNFATTAEVIEATIDKNGDPISERMRVVISKACQAKAFRDAVFKIVPRAVFGNVYRACQELIAGKEGTKPMAERRAAAEQWIATLKINPARVWSALGISGPADINVKTLETLFGFRQGIKEGECTLDECFPEINLRPEFPEEEKKPAAKPRAAKPATAPAPQPKSEETTDNTVYEVRDAATSTTQEKPAEAAPVEIVKPEPAAAPAAKPTAPGADYRKLLLDELRTKGFTDQDLMLQLISLDEIQPDETLDAVTPARWKVYFSDLPNVIKKLREANPA